MLFGYFANPDPDWILQAFFFTCLKNDNGMTTLYKLKFGI